MNIMADMNLQRINLSSVQFRFLKIFQFGDMVSGRCDPFLRDDTDWKLHLYCHDIKRGNNDMFIAQNKLADI